MRTVTIPYEQYQDLLSNKKEQDYYGYILYYSITGYSKATLYTKKEADKVLTDTIEFLEEENKRLRNRNLWKRIFNY